MGAMVQQHLSAWGPAGRPEEEICLQRCHDEMLAKVKQVNVSFFSKVGNGKSSSANTLLQAWGYTGEGFEARRQRQMVTTEVQTIEQEFKDLIELQAAEDDGEQRGEVQTIELELQSMRKKEAIPTTEIQTIEQEVQDPIEQTLKSDTEDAEGESDGEQREEIPSEEGAKDAEGDDDQTSATPSECDKGEIANTTESEGDGDGGCELAAPAVEEPTNVVLRVTDQPGLMDKSGNFIDLAGGIDAESARALAGEHANGYHVLFLVQKITDRLDAGEQAILRIVRRFYGEPVLRRIVLLLTYSDVADTDEEISNMVKEAKADVEAAVGGDIACAIPINNHTSRVAVNGKDRLNSGREMMAVIHDIVCSEDLEPEPFQPAEVDYITVVKYVEEEIEKHPHLKKDALLATVLRFVPVRGKKNLCSIL